MLPDPLHPAIVHFPVALAALMPLFALAALIAIYRFALTPRLWWAVVALQGALVLSAWLALESGEEEEERVEEVVAERYLEEHEEAAETLWIAALLCLALLGIGLTRAPYARYAHFAGALGTAVVLLLAVRTGHSGGRLVYQHGAARAYAQSPLAVPEAAGVERGEGHYEEDDDDD